MEHVHGVSCGLIFLTKTQKECSDGEMGLLLQLDGLIGNKMNRAMETRTVATYITDMVTNGTMSLAKDDIELCVKGLSGELNPNRDLR